MSVVLYGCETWSLTLREERRVKVLENKVLSRIFGSKNRVLSRIFGSKNRVLSRIFGSKKSEVTGEWRKVYIE